MAVDLTQLSTIALLVSALCQPQVKSIETAATPSGLLRGLCVGVLSPSQGKQRHNSSCRSTVGAMEGCLVDERTKEYGDTRG